MLEQPGWKGFSIRKNALLAVAEVAVTTLTLLLVYRLLVETLGLIELGIWSLVIASISLARLGDLGLSASVTRYVAAAVAHGDKNEAELIVRAACKLMIVLYVGLVCVAYYPLWMGLSLLLNGRELDSARAILPFSLGSLVLSSLGGVIFSSHAGYQKSFRRSYLIIAGNAVLIAGVLMLIKPLGLVGAALAQLVQAAVVALAGWLLLGNEFESTRPIETSRDLLRRVKQLVRYGSQVQVGSLLALLMDPAIKAIMAAVGGLGAVGVYEIAVRVVLQARLVIVAVNQTLVSVHADLQQRASASMFAVFDKAMAYTLGASVTIFGLLLLGAPAIAELAFSSPPAIFIPFVTMLCVGWLINTVSAPVYMLCLGTGQVKSTLIHHFMITILSPTAAYLLGRELGPQGVVIGAMLGLAAGSLSLLITYVRVFRPLRYSYSGGAA